MFAPEDDVMTTAYRLAAAFVSGRIEEVDAQTLRFAFPCATFAR